MAHSDRMERMTLGDCPMSWTRSIKVSDLCTYLLWTHLDISKRQSIYGEQTSTLTVRGIFHGHAQPIAYGDRCITWR
jgi:hypothetical protein